ncbi:hypothetical protein [Asticcacaulis sp. YBE204]|uniref:hypothetical protein n=1 Tax=Asticcacaulis sp. YBE204 TaxID=1282363 RepID=UPI0003C3C4C5|nr:hypothetical protein [Asticcacaulis sp. YBE204]ESQ79403.1 hypothetical protein AEYBE204_10370 [Asticcacaulis sp. YBE204]
MEFWHLVWVWSARLLFWTCGGLAIWRGGWAERSAAIVVFIAWVITPHLANSHYDPGLATLLLDASVTVFCYWIALKSRRIWPLFLTACMLATVLSHFAADFVPTFGYFAYITTMGLMGGYGVGLSFGVAVWECEHLRKTALRIQNSA